LRAILDAQPPVPAPPPRRRKRWVVVAIAVLGVAAVASIFVVGDTDAALARLRQALTLVGSAVDRLGTVLAEWWSTWFERGEHAWEGWW